MEVEIGIGKSGRRAYGFDDIAIVPSRRTRDPEDVDISWELDAFRFELPVIGAAMDGVAVARASRSRWATSAASAASTSKASGPATRTPRRCSRRSPSCRPRRPPAGCRRSTPSRSSEELIGQRIREIKDAGVIACASLTPQRVEQYAKHVLDAELDLLVIQGTVVSAEHVSKTVEPLNLKQFIREFEIPVIVGGCASYSTALHLMRTGAVGVLVGVGPGHACTTPRRARHRRAAGHRHRRRGRRADPSPRRDRRVRARHRRRRACAPAATSPRRSRAAPTR